jgi:hypothetical protein
MSLDASPNANGHGVSRALHDYVQRINASYRSSVGDPIETGQLLLEVKYRLGHGEFGKMFEENGERKLLLFGQRTAERLMAIAKNPVLSNPTHASKLPASWGTLYELTRFDDDTLQEMLDDGTINPDLERKDIEELRKDNEEAYNWVELSHSLKVLMKYVKRWPDPNKLADTIDKLDFDDKRLSELAAWLNALRHKQQADRVARKALWERQEEEDREAERERKEHWAKRRAEISEIEEQEWQRAQEESKAEEEAKLRNRAREKAKAKLNAEAERQRDDKERKAKQKRNDRA